MTTTLSVPVEVPSGMLGSKTEAELTADLRTTLAVRLFEQGRPTTEQIRAFKEDTRVKLLERYPSMIDDVFIESMI